MENQNQKEKLITILLTNHNTADFIALILYGLSKLTKNPYLVFINDNNSQRKDRANLIRLVQSYPNVFLRFRNSQNEAASLAHGRALDGLMANVQTKYTAIFDSDGVVLRKNWDEILIQRFNENANLKIIGSPLSGRGPNSFPFQFVLFLETETFKRLKISFQPIEGKEKDFDTCWQLEPAYLKAHYQGCVFEEKNTRVFQQGPFSSVFAVAEYYLPDKEQSQPQIFASHFGRGSTLGAAKYRKGLNFIFRLPKIGRLLRNIKGRQDKLKWLNIARSIIDKQ